MSEKDPFNTLSNNGVSTLLSVQDSVMQLIADYRTLIISVVLILILSGIFKSIIRKFDAYLASHYKGKVDPTMRAFIKKVLTVSVSAVILLTLLNTFGIPIGAILTFGGVGGLIVAFAARELLSNVLGGITVYTGGLFKMGDRIRIDGTIDGVVEQIGWRDTMIRTLDKKELYVPNARFNMAVVENYTRRTHRRLDEKFCC